MLHLFCSSSAPRGGSANKTISKYTGTAAASLSNSSGSGGSSSKQNRYVCVFVMERGKWGSVFTF